jgi:hypothetical protein
MPLKRPTFPKLFQRYFLLLGLSRGRTLYLLMLYFHFPLFPIKSFAARNNKSGVCHCPWGITSGLYRTPHSIMFKQTRDTYEFSIRFVFMYAGSISTPSVYQIFSSNICHNSVDDVRSPFFSPFEA